MTFRDSQSTNIGNAHKEEVESLLLRDLGNSFIHSRKSLNTGMLHIQDKAPYNANCDEEKRRERSGARERVFFVDVVDDRLEGFLGKKAVRLQRLQRLIDETVRQKIRELIEKSLEGVLDSTRAESNQPGKANPSKTSSSH